MPTALEVFLPSALDYAFKFCPSGLTWRDRNIATAVLAETRRHFFRSFGSCAFGQPVEEVERLRLA